MNDSIRIEKPSSEPRITMALGTAIIVQTALALVWAGGAAERIAQLERRVNASEEMIERTARVEEQVAAMHASLARIEMKLDREETQ